MKSTAIWVTLLTGSLLSVPVDGQIFRRGGQNYNQPFQQPAPQYQPQVQAQPGQAINSQSANGQVVVSGQEVTNQAPGGVQNPQIHQVQSVQPQKHWSQMLTDNREHDFGTVAKLSRQVHVFEFVNPLDTDLFIESASASCRCTIPSILTPSVKPGETARVQAEYDTRGFEGPRSATVRVRIRRNQPYFESAELLLNVKGMIRRDVVMDPGEFGFGPMKSGSTGSRNMLVKYAGNPQWQILEARPSSDRLKVSVQESRRDAGSMRVDYTITVEADGSIPKGDINEQIVLITNDPNMPQLSVPVTGRIKTGIEASDIRLGNLEQGKPVERKLLIKGDSAFAIVGIQSSAAAIQFAPSDNVHRTVHMLSYRLDTSKPGSLEASIVMRTTDPDQPELTIAAAADIVPTTFVRDSEEVAGGGKKEE